MSGELEHVDSCPSCDADFIGMTPDDMRKHIVEDHDQPLGEVLVWQEADA